MKDITIHGVKYTPEEAYHLLIILRKDYKFHKDRSVSFMLNGQEILTSYAKYLIEYLENYLKKVK